MAVTTTTRIPVTRWSASATDPFSRAQMDASHAAIDLYAARDEQGLEAAKPAPAIRGRWWFSTDTRKRMYRDDGTTLHELPLIAQQNDYTGVATFALASEAATQSTATNAPAGVTRPTATGHKSYFAMAKTAVRTWALGMAGTVADGSGETNALIVGAPDASMGIPTPLLYLGTTGTLRNTGTSYSGPYAAGTAATTRTASGQLDANNATVAAQGANANIGLVLAGQGTGPIILQPTVGTAVLTVAPTLITAAQRLAVTGGVDVNGSPSGYNGELRFTNTTGDVGISTSSVSGALNFDHRGTANVGTWAWRNGTGAGTTRMSLSATGNIAALGPDHRFGGYALLTGTNVTGLRLSTDTGNVYFVAEGDGANRHIHMRLKGSSNFYVENEAGALELSVSNTGVVTAASVIQAGDNLKSVAVGGSARLYIKATDAALDSKVWDLVPVGSNLQLRSINDAEASASTWMTLNRSGMTMTNVSFGTRVLATETGSPLGAGTTAGAIAFGDNDAHSWEGDGGGGWIFRNAWNSVAASFRFMGGVGGLEILRIESGGHLLTGGAAPTLSAVHAKFPTSSIVGSDFAGHVTLTEPDGTLRAAINANDVIAHVTFARAYAATPHAVAHGYKTSTAGAGNVVNAYADNVTTTGFDIKAGTAVNIDILQTLVVGYHVVG